MLLGVLGSPMSSNCCTNCRANTAAMQAKLKMNFRKGRFVKIVLLCGELTIIKNLDHLQQLMMCSCDKK